ncbi:unnamed protein product [Heligmosomoides polygyrus]|uniref:DUF1652 domain-containing protein n=1 Tax=Heligmosomoides polygyrus TaxID=6339 RepID=A0A183FIB3_HELPZ|nr:unnamed protein product [Heligmosomoides polygyrus]
MNPAPERLHSQRLTIARRSCYVRHTDCCSNVVVVDVDGAMSICRSDCHRLQTHDPIASLDNFLLRSRNRAKQTATAS